ncbi:MAG: trimethylamine corrinoid protein 2 [Lachnospiraceae bacterium]
MIHKSNWEETKKRWDDYWKHQVSGRPVMRVIARREQQVELPKEYIAIDATDKYTNAEKLVGRYRNFCENHDFLAESFPNLSVDFGPGSLAAYLGSDIVFHEDTVWFTEVLDDLEEAEVFDFDPENEWYKKHLELVKKCKELAGGDFLVCIPDLMENIDVLASLRGAQDMIFEMIDEPEEVEKRIGEIDDVYFEYYDRFYDVVKDEDGASAYTVFQALGYGKTAKIQCDFSALMSPTNYTDFIQESLRKQAAKLDNVLYHLDGPDAIKHLDAIMEIDEIDALQWTSGDYGPDGTLEDWYIIYDKAFKAGKSLWVKVYSGQFEDWLRNVDRIIKRYGSDRIFLTFPVMEREQADRLLTYADEHWSDVKAELE